MDRLPRGIPSANSAKWRSRRDWDWWGYLLARSLVNPSWQRDVDWLLRVATRKQGSAPQDEASYYADLVAALRRYPHTPDGRLDEGSSWDQVLTAVAELSLYVHGRHLAEVKAIWGEDYGRS